MPWYYADNGKQTGPVTDEEFQSLLAAGTVRAETLVWRDGMPGWAPYSTVMPASAPTAFAAASEPAIPGGVVCAECGKIFPPDQVIRIADRNVCATCKPILVQRLAEGATPGPMRGELVTQEQLLQREYRVEIGSCVERAWSVFTKNVGPVIISGLIYLAILLVCGGVFVAIVAVGFVPMIRRGGGAPSAMTGLIVMGAIGLVVGIVFMLAITIISAGYSWFYLLMARNGSADYGEIFVGFRRKMGSLLGAWLIQVAISIAISVPFTIIIQVMAMSGKNSVGLTALSGVFQLISTAISVYLAVIWTYTNILILDKNLRAWPALQLSRKMVHKAWWMTALFWLLGMIIAGSGAIVCGIGLLVTAPLFLLMRVHLYDDNFRDLQPAVD